MKKSALLFLLALCFSAAVAAKGVDDRVRAMEERWRQYDASRIEQNARLAAAIAQLDRIKSEIQALGGGTETHGVQMQQLQNAMERRYRDLEMRLASIESQLKFFQDQLNRAVAKVAPQMAEEGRLFQKGLTQIQNGDYNGAIASFQQFAKQYPKSPQRPDALFWVAECRYSMRDYSQAIKDYQKFVEQFPRSSRAPQAVLKQGDAFLNLQMKEEAEVFWNKLVQDYPKSEEAAIARSKLTSLRETGTAPAARPTPVHPVPLPPSSDLPAGESDAGVTVIPPNTPRDTGDF